MDEYADVSATGEVICAHCGAELVPDHDELEMAMTSRNTALLFHRACLNEMHERAYVLDSDERRMVIERVKEMMERG